MRLAAQNLPAATGKPICRELTEQRGYQTNEIDSEIPFTGSIVKIYESGHHNF
jgi:hypothetical protein